MSLRPRWLIWLAILSLFSVGLLLALPELVRLGGQSWLRDQGLQAQIEDIDLNLFTGRARIRGVNIRNSAQRGLQLQSLAVALRYAPLFQKRLHLSELQVNGLSLDVARKLDDDNNLEIAGLPISSNGEKSEASAWGFGLDKTQVDSSTITYHDPLLKQSITLQAGSVNDLATWGAGQPVRIDSQAKLSGGQLHIQGQVQPFGEQITAELAIQAQALPLASAAPLIPDENIRIDGLVHADLNLTLAYQAEQGIELQLSGDSRLRKYQLGLAKPALEIGGDVAHWQGTLQVATATDTATVISSQGKAALSELNVRERNSQIQLLKLKNLDVPRFQLNSPTDISLTAVELGSGHSLQHPDQDPQLGWQAISVASLAYQNGNLAVGPVKVKGAQARLQRNEQGNWNIQQSINSALNTPAVQTDVIPESAQIEPADSAQPPEVGEKPLLQVASFAIEDGQLQFADGSIQPELTMQLQKIDLQLSQLDSAQPLQASPLSLTTGVGDYGRLSLQGTIKPFATPPAASLQGKISGIDTVPLSGFTRKLVGHRIKQGTVSGDLNINIDEGRLNSSIDLVLNKLQIAAIKGQAGEFEKSSGMPLSTALGLLRDRDENIHLKLPITGELDKPDVNINNIIRQAIFKGVSTAALAFYSPLGVITAGDKLLQLATALRFDPVVFAAGGNELDPTAISHLATLTDVLIQRPGLQISLCGIAAPADRQALAETIATENTRLFGLYRPDAEPEAVPDERLLKLARARMRKVGDYLSENGIDPARLILCDGEISDESNTKPGVRIEL